MHRSSGAGRAAREGGLSLEPLAQPLPPPELSRVCLQGPAGHSQGHLCRVLGLLAVTRMRTGQVS